MSSTADTPSREARLAARLRENLHRRKAQARARSMPAGETPPPAEHAPGSGLPKGEEDG